MSLTVSVDEIVQGSRNPALGIRPLWRRIRLREIASVLNGFAFKSTQFTKGDGMPLIRIRDVGSDSTDTNYVGEFDERYTVEPGDLLIGMDGDFNCARWRGPRGLLNQRVCKVTLQSDQYHPRFLDFALPGYLKAINDATSSVTVKHLSSRTVEDIPLPCPPLHEQEEIVAELEKQFSRLDEAVANLKRVKANLERFEGAGIRDATQAAKRGSPIHRASELFSWSSGVNLPASKQDGGPVPVYGGNGITGYHSQSNIDQATVVIGRVGAGCGNVHLVREAAWITDNAVYATRVAESIFLPYAALMFGAAKLNSSAAGSGQPFVNQRMLNEVQLPLPSLDEQRRIVAEVDRCFSIVREVEADVDANLGRASVLRKAVLARAFSTPAD